jgi:predicted CoA-binding protein
MTNNTQKSQAIEAFLNAKTYALVGVSRDNKKFSNTVFRELLKKNWNVIPVNPVVDSIEGHKCYKSLSDVPVQIDAVISMAPKDKTDEITAQVVKGNIKLFWIHQKLDTPESLSLCEANNITCITGECILMFADPVGSFHKFHRWIKKVFGSYPM